MTAMEKTLKTNGWPFFKCVQIQVRLMHDHTLEQRLEMHNINSINNFLKIKQKKVKKQTVNLHVLLPNEGFDRVEHFRDHSIN